MARKPTPPTEAELRADEELRASRYMEALGGTLTPNPEDKVYEALKSYIVQHGKSPRLEELDEATGHHTSRIIKRLKEAGKVLVRGKRGRKEYIPVPEEEWR